MPPDRELVPQTQLPQVSLRAAKSPTPLDAVVTRLIHQDLNHRLPDVEVELLRDQTDTRLGSLLLAEEVVSKHNPS